MAGIKITRKASGGFCTQRNTSFANKGSSMAFGVTARGSFITETDATSFSTAAFTPTASELLIACYGVERTSSINPTTPTVSGHDGGVAWTLITSLLYETDAGTRRSIFLFACVTGGSPSSAAVTFSHGAVSHSAAAASVFEISGADEANGLVQAFVASYLGPVDALTNTIVTINLNAAADVNNRPFAFFVKQGNEDFVPRTNWTEIQDLSTGDPGRSLESQWRSDTFETTASATWATNATQRSGIAWELKVAAAGGDGHPSRRRLTGLSRRLGHGS